MARVVMQHWISGGRGDGSEWPGAGDVLECGEAEARELVAGGNARWAENQAAPVGVAEPAVEPPEAEPADDEPSEPENGSESDGKPRVRDPKEAWEAYAVALGATPDAVSAMSKADLIGMYGK